MQGNSLYIAFPPHPFENMATGNVLMRSTGITALLAAIHPAQRALHWRPLRSARTTGGTLIQLASFTVQHANCRPALNRCTNKKPECQKIRISTYMSGTSQHSPPHSLHTYILAAKSYAYGFHKPHIAPSYELTLYLDSTTYATEANPDFLVSRH